MLKFALLVETPNFPEVRLREFLLQNFVHVIINKD